MLSETETGSTRFYTNSEVQAFKRCQRRWWLQYVLRLHPQSTTPTGADSLGTAVHASLEHYYLTGDDPGDYVYEGIYQPVIQEYLDRDEVYTAHELSNKAELARIMLSGYKEWAETTGLDARYTQIFPEKVIDFQLWPGVKLICKPDLMLVDENDQVSIRDFKTRDQFDTSLLHLDEQMLTYAMVQNRIKPQQFVVGSHVLLRKVKQTRRAKPPFYLEAPVYHNAGELERHLARLVHTIREMELAEERMNDYWSVDPSVAGLYSIPTPMDRCSWDCKYQEPCALLNTGEGWQEYLQEHYVESDSGYSRGFWIREIPVGHDGTGTSPYPGR